MQTNIRTHADSSISDRNLQKYIAKSKKRLQAILKRLQWSEELVLKNCNSKSDATATLLPHDEAEPLLPATFGSNNSVVIAEDALRALVADPSAEIPQRFSDLQCNFSREQKLEIYEHVVQNTEKLLEPELTVPINDESHRSITFAEIVAIKKREKKQKRRKYRTSKPTHIEEVRNLVELQMQALEQYLNPDKVAPARLCHRERDLLKKQEERSRSTSKDNLRKTALKEELSKMAQNAEKRERRKRSVSRQRNLHNDKYPRKLENDDKTQRSADRESKHKRRSRSRRRSISRERRHINSSKHKTNRDSPRDRKHRSRSRDRRHKSRTRSKERRHQSRSKERKHKSRSRSKERRHKKSRSRSKSSNRKNSSDRRDYRNRSISRSHEKRETRTKEHYHKRSDYKDRSRSDEKSRYKKGRYGEKSRKDESRTYGNSKNEHRTKGKSENSKDPVCSRDSSSDNYIRNKTDPSSTQNTNVKLEPVLKRQSSHEEIVSIMNNVITSHDIKQEIKIDPDSKTEVLELFKIKDEPHTISS